MIEGGVIFVLVEFFFGMEKWNKEFVFGLFEVLVNCVEGWEVIVNI